MSTSIKANSLRTYLKRPEKQGGTNICLQYIVIHLSIEFVSYRISCQLHGLKAITLRPIHLFLTLRFLSLSLSASASLLYLLALTNSQLTNSHNTEKVIYFLLLDRKLRRPAFEDETEVIIRNRSESGTCNDKLINILVHSCLSDLATSLEHSALSHFHPFLLAFFCFILLFLLLLLPLPLLLPILSVYQKCPLGCFSHSLIRIRCLLIH